MKVILLILLSLLLLLGGCAEEEVGSENAYDPVIKSHIKKPIAYTGKESAIIFKDTVPFKFDIVCHIDVTKLEPSEKFNNDFMINQVSGLVKNEALEKCGTNLILYTDSSIGIVPTQNSVLYTFPFLGIVKK